MRRQIVLYTITTRISSLIQGFKNLKHEGSIQKMMSEVANATIDIFPPFFPTKAIMPDVFDIFYHLF